MALAVEVMGSAGAAPLQGACPSYLVSDTSTSVLLDCGPGSLERLWQRGCLGRLDAVVISHMHADHILDLVPFSGELAQAFTGGAPLPLYVPREHGPAVLRQLDAAFSRPPDDGDHEHPTRFDTAFHVREYDSADRFNLGPLEFSFAATAHAQPCFATRVTNGSATLVYGADGSPSDALDALAAGKLPPPMPPARTTAQAAPQRRAHPSKAVIGA